jgi:hypothetical protein
MEETSEYEAMKLRPYPDSVLEALDLESWEEADGPCRVNNFQDAGIMVTTSTTAELHLYNTLLREPELQPNAGPATPALEIFLSATG